ncbi:FecR family protein [Sphingomonas sanxanigenens]|uniref:FecR protein domain-containing protein n=1 Tax=Sphingomonas sanxanigenens DSM 19645 = NX02 TaxID=1123269 RepID=W0ADY6_9SPHN|nr:FecR domain-containing protein [Sphingomonas sanxanigenens]AHE55306.1 hypothetical protein NX02_18185 [Sphingomonas sanxanigenens DSM 19645 = NX02]
MALKPENPIEKAATAWVIATDRGLSTEESETLDRWLAQDVRHRGAFVRAQAIWSEAIGDAPPAAQPPLPRAPWVTRRRILIGGGLAAAAAGTGLILARPPSYETERGETRRLALADGTSALLNTASRMVVRFSAQRRAVELAYGEAWFQVARDPARPFIVDAGGLRIGAVGTAFSVKMVAMAIEVIVTEGVVALAAAGGRSRRVSEGQRAAVSASGEIELGDPGAEALARHLAWREGLVMFDGETLAQAIAEINRYNRRQIVIAPRLRDIRMVGVFRTGDVEGFADAVTRIAAAPMRLDGDRILLGL